MAPPHFQQRSRTSLSPPQPLLYAALAFAGGIMLAANKWFPATWSIAATSVFILAAALLFTRQRAISLTCGLAALAALGTLNFQVRERPATNPAIVEASGSGSEVIVTGHVIRDGVFRAGKLDGAPQRQTVDIETEEIIRDGVPSAVRAGLRLNLYDTPQKRTSQRLRRCRKPARRGNLSTASACGLQPGYGCRVTSGIPAHLITASISPDGALLR